MLENMVQRRIPGTEGDEVTREERFLPQEELPTL